MGKADEQCLGSDVASEILQLSPRQMQHDSAILRATCTKPYQLQDLAPRIPRNVWNDVYQALLSRDVNQASRDLQRQIFTIVWRKE